VSAIKEPVLIAGSGNCAEQVVVQLASAGTRLLVVTAGSTFPVDTGLNGAPPIEVLTDATIEACCQKTDDFRVDFTAGGNHFSRTVSSIVLAEPEQRKTNFSLYGVRSSDRVVPLSEMIRQPDPVTAAVSTGPKPLTIVFLTGLTAESNPVILSEVMQAAYHLQTDSHPGGTIVQTYILTKNLKVGADGLEALYRKTKEAGTIYVKFTDAAPDIIQKKDDVRITFTDEITGLPFKLTPDITVVDETILPPRRIDGLSAIFGLAQDKSGFAQTDNVHRLPVFTNRNGIFVTGAARDVLGPDDQMGEAANVAMAALGWMSDETPPADDKARIEKGACIRCLTCYRLCPYHAISLDVYPMVIPKACERCGICASECPQHAIDIPGMGRQEITEKIGSLKTDDSADPVTPFVVAFCCSRSGSQAARLATLMGQDLPSDLKIIEVPCAGSLSFEHIFSGYQQGADGVLVLTCHEGNCHSTEGNIHARRRVDNLKERLAQIGYDAERLEIQTIASNMGTEFAAFARQFSKKITALGPNPLRR